METCGLLHRIKSNIWSLTILIITAALASLLSVKNIIISSDSIRYALVSQEIIAGNGIQIPIIGTSFGFSTMIPVDGTVPFTVQPPLLPILLALLGGISPYDYFAAQVLNAVCHVAIAIFTFLLMRKYSRSIISLLTGILVSTSLPLLLVTHHVTSETLFIALTMGAIYFLTLSRQNSNQQSSRQLYIGGIFTAASIMTRYAGVAILPLFLWEAYVLIKNKKNGASYKSALLALTIPVTALILLFARSYMILGTMRGLKIPPPDRSYLESFTGLVKMLFMQFHLGPRSSIAVASVILLCITYIIMKVRLRKEAVKYFHSGLDLIIIFVICYTGLIYIALAKEQPYFELRYVSPLVPFLFIIFIFTLVFVGERLQFRTFSRSQSYVIFFSLAIITLVNCYKTYLVMPEFLYKQEKVYSIVSSCTYDWLNETYGKGTAIATNKPFRLSFFGEYSAVVLPNRKWVKNAPIPDDMETTLPRKMSEVGAEVLALFDEVKNEQFGTYVSDLFKKMESNDQFSLAHTCSDGVVYTLKK